MKLIQLLVAAVCPSMLRHRASGSPHRKLEPTFRMLLFLVVLGVGCTTEPTSDGSASINGQALRATGAPWAGTTVEILCSAGSDTTRTSTDSAGAFGTSLDFANTIRGDQTSMTSCRFAAPGLATPQAAVTQTITLYPSLQPMQRVTLREGST